MGNGVAAAVAGVAPPDGVAPAVAIPRRGRGHGRSHNLTTSVAAGVVGPPPARDPPATAVARNCSTAAHGAKVDGQISGSCGTVTASDRGRAFCTPINRGRKRRTRDGDDDNEGGFSASNIMDDDGVVEEQTEFQGRQPCGKGGRASSLARGDCYALRGDDVPAANTARGEPCASSDDERHAHGNDA